MRRRWPGFGPSRSNARTFGTSRALQSAFSARPSSSSHRGQFERQWKQFNRTCVAREATTCHVAFMSLLVRSILAILLSVSLFGATVGEASSVLAAEIAAVEDPCCEGDCPKDMTCGAACETMMRGGGQVFSPPLVQALVLSAPETSASLLMADMHPPSGLPPDSLRRPPRV